jgi:recombination protein RecR
MNWLKSHSFDEIILATNWTINGEATAVFVKKIINELTNANVYRLALGLPINSALDYADNMTLKFAIKNKTKY